MASEFVEKRHENPDHELEVYITGVKLGDTGKVHWKVSYDACIEAEVAAEILDRAAKVLRGEE